MKIFKYSLLIITVLLLFSCGENLGGLFYSLEQESAISNGTLPDNITIGSMARSGDYYFISAGKFQYRKFDAAVEEEWKSTPPAGDYKEYITYDMVLIGDTIYAVFYNVAGTDFRIFKTDAASAPNISWSGPEVFTDSKLTGKKIIGFKHSNTKVFIYATSGVNSYSVYSADYSTFSASSALTQIADNIPAGGELRVDFDGSLYWITAGNKVYTTDGDSAGTDITSAVMDVSTNLKGDGFSGVVCADTDTEAGTEVYITSEEGVIAKYVGGSWTLITSQYDTDNGLFEPLNDIFHIVISDENLNIIIAGSENGYYEMQASKDVESKSFISPERTASSLTTSNQYSSIAMSEQIMNSFFLDDTTAGKEKIFALGYNSGLWVNSLKTASDGTTYRFWDAE